MGRNMTLPRSSYIEVVRDSCELRWMLKVLDVALDIPLEHLSWQVRTSKYGEETSLAEFGTWWEGWDEGWNAGWRRGRKRGIDDAYQHVYGRSAKDVAARVQAKRRHRNARSK